MNVVQRLDGRPLKAQGIHPVEQVMAGLAALKDGEAFQFVSPHAPQPILDRTAAAFDAVVEQVGPEEFVTTFTRRGAPVR